MFVKTLRILELQSRAILFRFLYCMIEKYRMRTAIFMEAIPLCLLLNKPHLFSLTQHTSVVLG